MNTNLTTYFDRFEITLPEKCVDDCSHQGPCDEDVEFWFLKLPESTWPDDAAIRSELRDYGAWETAELNSPHNNRRRLLWLAACQIKEENQ